ncbi:hypothetical protein B566_EDAN011415 [Ephemera danica]|nr:hypothetical protein B566_EDAN011415 [Ephemera danica]
MSNKEDHCEKVLLRKTIQTKMKDFLKSRKNANNLVDILNMMSDKIGKGNMMACILALEKMVENALRTKSSQQKAQSDAEQQYFDWLWQQYKNVLVQLLTIISSSSYAEPIREQAVVTYMKLLIAESSHVNKPKDGSNICLPQNNFLLLLKAMFSGKSHRENRKLLARFQEYSAYHDVALQIWTSVAKLTIVKPDTPHSESLMKSILAMLQQTPVPTSSVRKEEPSQMLFPKRGGSFPLKALDKALKKEVDQVWNNIQHWPHTDATLQNTILLILEKLISHLSKPILLTDFFITSMEKGGAISVLALQGIFKLIQNHNIDYPNIYDKLYSLFTPDVFRTQYKSRLFFLADIFLSSSHLPEALVASFAKRLARLALLAPAPDILIILPFIGNLLLRHKGLQILINHSTGDLVQGDPFLEREPDPMKTLAMDSSLWEVKSLQMHIVPSVAIAARFINDKLPSVEWDLSEVLDGTYEQMFQKERNRKVKRVSLTFIRPDPEKIDRKNELELNPFSLSVIPTKIAA